MSQRPDPTDTDAAPTWEPDAIYVVEDDDAFYEALALMIRRTPFAHIPLHRAASLEQAESLLADRSRGNRPPVVLCDQTLPDSAPGQTLRQLLKFTDDQAVVIAMTALDDVELAGAVSRMGAQDYIVKDELNPRYLERRLRAAIERKELVNEVARKNAELDAFSKLVAHDLKSPIGVIQLDLGALERAQGRPEDVRRVAASIQTECTAMVEIINAMQDFAQATIGRWDRETLRPHEAARVAVQQLRVLVDERKAEVRIEDMPEVVGAKRPLIQVFQNLIANAIRHNERQTPSVLVSGDRRDGMVRITVVDNGVGIDGQQHERIFEIGTQVSTARGGTGLGLAIARRHVERQGGRLFVGRSDPSGTEFVLELCPAIAAEAARR